MAKRNFIIGVQEVDNSGALEWADGGTQALESFQREVERHGLEAARAEYRRLLERSLNELEDSAIRLGYI